MNWTVSEKLVAELTGAKCEAVCSAISEAETVRGLFKLEPAQLRSYGFTKKQIARLRALEDFATFAHIPKLAGRLIRSVGDISDYYLPLLRFLEVEQFRVVLLDGKHRVIKEIMVHQGTLTLSPVHPREVFRAAIKHGSAAIVLVHNHPSGDPTPSVDDIEITKRLILAGEVIGIRIIDHVIVGADQCKSFIERCQ